MRCRLVSCSVVILMMVACTSQHEIDLCRYFSSSLFDKYDLTIISPALDKVTSNDLKSTITYCIQLEAKKGKKIKKKPPPELSTFLKWMPIVRTYINCKLCSIMLKLLLLIEHYSLHLFKTNNSVDTLSQNLKKVDEDNWLRWKTVIMPNLIQWKDVLKIMILILRDFDEREKRGDFKNPSTNQQKPTGAIPYDSNNVGYLMEAFRTYYLFLEDSQSANPERIPSMKSFNEIQNDKKLNRARLIQFYAWDLMEKYSVESCNLNVAWNFGLMESWLKPGKDPLITIKSALENHLNDSSVIRVTWKHAHELDNSLDYFSRLVDVPHPGELNSEWVKTLEVRAQWNGVKKSITQLYEDEYQDYRPANRAQISSLVTEMLLSVFFHELCEYIEIYVSNVMKVPEKNLYFGSDSVSDPHLLKPVRYYIRQMDEILKRQRLNSPSKHTIELIYKNITEKEYNRQLTTDKTTAVGQLTEKKSPTTLNVVDLLLTIEVMAANYGSMGILLPKRKIKVFKSSRHADGHLAKHNNFKIQSHIDNLKLYFDYKLVKNVH